MTNQGRRKGLKDIKEMLKVKEAEYEIPISRLAGFVIQQVWSFCQFILCSALPAGFQVSKSNEMFYWSTLV
jgi:hypothetical protein